MAEVTLICNVAYLNVEVGRVVYGQVFNVSDTWWHRRGKLLGDRVLTAERYVEKVLHAKESVLQTLCRKRRMDDQGTRRDLLKRLCEGLGKVPQKLPELRGTSDKQEASKKPAPKKKAPKAKQPELPQKKTEGDES